MKRVLLIDTETTGLDPKTDRVIEVAAILYSVEHATPLHFFSSLLRADANPAEAINRIPAAALVEAPEPATVWARVGAIAEQADAIVAHNAEFDRGFVPAALDALRPWICTMQDLQWPRQGGGRSLVALALDHDLGVAYAHRALADCDLIARLLTRSRELGADLAALLARGLRPKAKFAALVSYDDREKAKTAGFSWDGPTKTWWRVMAREDAAALPFRVREIA